jgi:site-specific recombinase XerD
VFFDASKDRWVAAVTIDRKVVKRLFKTRPEAEAGARLLVRAAEDKRLATSRQTFDEYIAEWLVEHIRVHRAARTYEAYKGKLGKHVSPVLGRRRLAEIEPRHIRELYQRLRDRGTKTRHKDPQRRPLSPTTIATIHVILHSAFAWAVRDERIPSNPLDRVHAPE